MPEIERFSTTSCPTTITLAKWLERIRRLSLRRTFTVGRAMRDLAMNIIKNEPITIDAQVYAPNEYVYAKDVALALHLACRVSNPKQRIYNAGTGSVTAPEQLAQMARELAPNSEIKVVGSTGADGKAAALDLSM